MIINYTYNQILMTFFAHIFDVPLLTFNRASLQQLIMYITVEANDIMMFFVLCVCCATRQLPTCHELHDKYFYIIKVKKKFSTEIRSIKKMKLRVVLKICGKFSNLKGSQNDFVCMFSTTSSIGLNQLGVIAKYFVFSSHPPYIHPPKHT